MHGADGDSKWMIESSRLGNWFATVMLVVLTALVTFASSRYQQELILEFKGLSSYPVRPSAAPGSLVPQEQQLPCLA